MKIVKIGLFLAFPFPGNTGTPLHAMMLAKALLRKGHEVEVYRKDKENNNFVWENINIFSGSKSYIIKYFKKMRPDIIIAEHVGLLGLAEQLSLKYNVPLIYEAHSFWKDEHLLMNNTRKTIIKRFRSAFRLWNLLRTEKKLSKLKNAHIIVMSTYLKAKFMYLNIPSDRIRLIYPSVFNEWLRHTNDFLDSYKKLSNNYIRIGYAGNFSSYQGLDLLIKSINIIQPKEINVPLKIRIIGGNKNNLSKELIQMIDNSEKHNAISYEFIGRVPYEKVPQLLSECHILTIPRRDYLTNYTVPRKLGEYLAIGRPLVVTDVGDHKRIVESEEVGIVAAPTIEEYSKGLVCCINKIINNKDYLKQVMTKSKEIIEEYYHIEKNINKYIDLISHGMSVR